MPRSQGVDDLARKSLLPKVIGRMRPAERMVAAGAFFTLFGFTTGHALLETARDALFLGRLSASRLPWVYLAIAVIALVAAEYQGRVLRRWSSKNELSVWLVLASLITCALWLALQSPFTWAVYVLYVWTGVLATLVVVRFWTLLGMLFTATQAKRIYAFVASGSVLGAILGAALARVLTGFFPASSLVLVAAIVFLLASPAPRLLDHRRLGRLPRARGIGSARQLTKVAQLIWTRPYLRRVGTLIVASTITFTLIDFVFKTAVDRSIPADQLGEFFATFYLGLNALSLAVQLLGVSWLIRRLGVNRAVAIVPAVLVVGALSVSFGGALVFALLLKGADGGLRHSLFRTGSELFWVPIPLELRVRVKPVIDTLGQRGGQAVASLVILALLGFTTREAPYAALAAVMATAWFFLVLDLRRHYIDVFRASLDSEISDVRFDLSSVDAATLQSLVTALDDADEPRVLTALDLLSAMGQTRAIPILMLRHPSHRVVRCALDHLSRADRPDLAARLPELMEHSDGRVRAAALRVAIRRGNEALLGRGLEDQESIVRATASAGIKAIRGGGDDLITEALNGPPEARRAVARALAERPVKHVQPILLRLTLDVDPRVRIAAVAALGDPAHLGIARRLIMLLQERQLRDGVRRALVGLGTGGVDVLREVLTDPATPHAVRRQIPDSIAEFGGPHAARTLSDRLLAETDGMIRFKIIRALGRMRRRDPILSLDQGALGRSQLQAEQTALMLMDWRHSLEDRAAAEGFPQSAELRLLVALLKDKERNAVERLFRLLNLGAENDDYFRVHRGLESGISASISSSCELLEHLVPPGRSPGLYWLIQDLYETDITVDRDRSRAEMKAADALRDLVGVHRDKLGALAESVLNSGREGGR